ncbi:response regulator, partial [Desulfobacterales bacterium HSG2]|nr:response regulator [Desulfobacterales bacterium HSG2]
VAIVDYLMPGLKGDEVMRQIHLKSPETLTVLLSGHAGNEELGQSVNRGNLYRYIAKPWDKEQLFLVIREATEKFTHAKLVHEHQKEIEALNASLEQKVAERTRAALEAQREAETASQAKSMFLANMSHELRTPLNAILGYAQILRRDRNLTTAQTDGLDVIRKSGQHLLTLINDILDLSKIEARKMELFPTDLGLPEFLDSIVGIIRMRAQQGDVRFVYEIDSKLPACIQADETRLRQVLINLLGNAVKFTESGGTVTFRVMTGDWPLTAEKTPRQSEIRFEVEDTGVGIAPELVETIFQPFEQVGNSQQRAQGTGLGLAVSRQLVELMGGELRVTSEPGKGSLFYFEAPFPFAEVPAEEERTVQQEIIGYTGEQQKILVVDDREENRLVLLNMLKPPGFDVTLAEHGRDGVEKAGKILPDCILMDLMMPVMSGFEAVKAIRQIPELRDVPIIAISASVFEPDRAKSEVAGCDDFLPKPVDAGKLFSLIGKHLSLTWTYREHPAGQETPAPPPPEAEIIPPPLRELEVLYEMAMFGDLQKVEDRMEYLEETDPKYSAFARKVREFAKHFEDEPILALVEQYMEVKQ